MPISKAIGGIYGLLRQIGIEITQAAKLASNTTLTFLGTVAFNKEPTVQGSDVALVEQGAITASDSAGGMFSWVNPWTVPVLITDFRLEVTTASTGACTVDAGIAANATTSDDSLIDGQDVNSAAGVFSASAPVRLDEAGGTADTVTVSVATGASAGIVGRAYIQYVPIQ